MKKRGGVERGEILQPGVGDLIHHLPGMMVNLTSRGYNEMVAMQVGDETLETVTHCDCRRGSMAKYEGFGRLRYATRAGNDGNLSWRGEFWREAFSPIILVSGFAIEPSIILLDFPVAISRGISAKRKFVSVVKSWEATVIIICGHLGMMAPKRSMLSPPSGRPRTRGATREHERAAQAANHFKEKIPPEIQADIAKVEQGVWKEVEQGIPEAEFNELAEWIQDPGKTCGRLSLYQRAITYFWAAKCLMARTMMDHKHTEPRAEVQTLLWDIHYNDARLMHRKLDVIANKMGIKFCAPEVALTVKAASRSAGGQAPKLPNSQVP